MKKFSIPVTWEVWDKIEIEAETIEEAIRFFEDNVDVLPLGTDPEYREGSHHIMDGEDGNANIHNTIKYLKENWDLSGGITGEEIDTDYTNIPIEATGHEDEWER